MRSASDPGQGMVPLSGLDDELAAVREEVARLQAENARLLRLLELSPREARPPGRVQTGIFDARPGPVHASSPAAPKVAFFAVLVAARRDVYALRWENAREAGHRLNLGLFIEGVLIDPRGVGCRSTAVTESGLDVFVDAARRVAGRWTGEVSFRDVLPDQSRGGATAPRRRRSSPPR